MHYRIRANVYKLLGRGVVGSCFGVHFFVRILWVGFHTLVNLLWLHSSSVLVWTRVRLRFPKYAGFSDRRWVRGGLPSLCSASSFQPGW